MHTSAVFAFVLASQNLAADKPATPPAAPAAVAPAAPAAAATTAPAAPAPEIKRTVEALAGKWNIDATVKAVGDAAPTKVKATMDCKKVAAGTAVACSLDPAAKAAGNFAQSCLIGYEADSKIVHMMCMSAAGKTQHQKGTWKDDKNLDFEPLKRVENGLTITETTTFTWADTKTLAFASVTNLGDGGQSTFQAQAKRK